MKKIFLFILITFSISSCYAQKEIKTGTLRAKGKKLKVLDATIKDKDGKARVIIIDQDYKYANSAPPPPKVKDPFPMQKKDIHFDQEQVKSIISGVLERKMSKLKADQEGITLSFTFYQNGAIAHVGYLINKKTNITIDDIAEIDAQLKNKIRAMFTGKDYLQYEVIHFNFPRIVFK